MKRPSKTILLLTHVLIALTFSTLVSAQQEANRESDQGFEATLHVVLGTSESGTKDELPAGLANVARDLRTTFGFSSLRLVNTYHGRVGNGGTIDYKSISNIQGETSDAESPSFLDWRLSRVRSIQNAGERPSFSIELFRFGARIPIKAAGPRDESGKSANVNYYESIGLNLEKTGIPSNSPTLVGTLALPKTTGTIFLILTIKPVEN
ncbi:MAG: hypothetical protein ACT4O9_16340 [Blastocatellia bacterium]